MKLKWSKFQKFIEARDQFYTKSCIYVQADPSGNPVRIGKASKGLNVRYRGGTGYALDAAMHESGNLFFVAAVPYKSCKIVETELIWRGRELLSYNNQGKINPPKKRINLTHSGEKPDFSGFE